MEKYELKKLSESNEVVGKIKLVSAHCETHLPHNPIRLEALSFLSYLSL
jgi:hypothetical protein